MPLSKPPGIEPDAFESAKWDEITAGRDFAPSDAPTLALLCQWHKVAQQAMDELDSFEGETAYQDDMPEGCLLFVCSPASSARVRRARRWRASAPCPPNLLGAQGPALENPRFRFRASGQL